MCARSALSQYLWLVVFLQLFTSNVALAQCGSLVTYRQHAVLLQSAPQCLRDGCFQGQNNTISSTCPPSSPCSAYWNMFVDQFDETNSWCSSCDSDIACRIKNWPVMNATALCEATPNQLLFGNEGCCARNNEPFLLANWTRTLCNSSEWQARFDDCGGMACLDWREWIMPWNWTVQNSLLPADQQDCKPASEYLAIYAGEHFFWLLATFGIGYLRLRIAKHEEANNRSIFRFLIISSWTHITSLRSSNDIIKNKLQDKFLAEGEHLRPSFTDPLKWGFPLVMGVFLAGLQLGFNFLVAHVIRSAPGYDQVPLGLLALLFCCRPRLSWLSCLLALVPNTWLEKWFKFKPKGDGIWAAKLVLSSVAVSAAVSEALLQILGAYILGTTATIGQQRSFYIVHNLRPKWRGNHARRMYLGALFWLMVCIPLLIVWTVIATFSAEVYTTVLRFRRGVFDFMKRKEGTVSERARPAVVKIREIINPDSEDQPYRAHAGYYAPQDQPQRAMAKRPFEDQPTRYDGAAGGLSDDQPYQVLRTAGGSRYTQVWQTEIHDQPFMVPRLPQHDPRAVLRNDIPSPPAGQRRTASGGQYGALAQQDEDEGSLVASGSAYSPSAVQRRTTSGQQYNALSQLDEDTIDTVIDQPMASTSSHSRFRHETTHEDTVPSHHDGVGTTVDGTSSSDVSSTNKRADYRHELALKRQTLQAKVILTGAFLGMLAYAAQWVFWDGFIKASGDRFCPPNYWKVNGIWWGGSVVYVGAPLMAY